MTKTIVSLGVDCGVANFLKENGLRNFSLPFDWVVSYGGVSNILKNNFSNYIPKDNSQFNRKDNVKFIHENFPADIEKMNRRINRFLNLLNDDKEIIFLRKGHSEHHHSESEVINDDLLDCEELYDILKENYKNLKFKIILFLVCFFLWWLGYLVRNQFQDPIPNPKIDITLHPHKYISYQPYIVLNFQTKHY